LPLQKCWKKAGCSLLTVHGRTKENKGKRQTLADLYIIKRIKQELKIPVISNGNISTIQDVENALKITGADGVMSAEGILKNPALFSGQIHNPFEMSIECIEFGEKYGSPVLFVKNHLLWILKNYITQYTDMRDNLLGSKTFDELRGNLTDFEDAVKNGRTRINTAIKVKDIKDITEAFDCKLFGNEDVGYE